MVVLAIAAIAVLLVVRYSRRAQNIVRFPLGLPPLAKAFWPDHLPPLLHRPGYSLL